MSDAIVSNEYGEDEKGKPIYIDRIYTNLHKDIELVNKNGSQYKGKIDRRSIKLSDGTLGHAYVTADNRWFNNSGMPINKPVNLITHK
tara:strand:+ start:500 stop:763 length:264 start_codon:yes stop_codon:yes gene_type:complete